MDYMDYSLSEHDPCGDPFFPSLAVQINNKSKCTIICVTAFIKVRAYYAIGCSVYIFHLIFNLWENKKTISVVICTCMKLLDTS